MGDGYVLDYSNATFEEFFYRYEMNIHSDRYQTYGTSKAKKMRAFWEREPDALVARVLSEMLDSYEADCDLKRARTRCWFARKEPCDCCQAFWQGPD